MRNKKNILVTTLLVVGLMFLLAEIFQFKNQVNNLNKENTVLSLENVKVKQLNSDSAAVISNLNSDIQKHNDTIKSLPKLEEYMIQQMKTKGFKGDAEEIISDLVKHSELIPYKGVVGGTMNFYDVSKIYVLTDQWVLASFNDGHIGGYMLLKYDMSNGKILWKVMSSYLG